MDKRKLKIALSLAVLIPCVLYAAGIIAQFIININAWKAAGSDYRTSPGLPSSQISEVVRALFHFPAGLIAIGVVVLGIAVLCVFGLRIGWGQNGVTDSDRNLTVSNSGSYGTASFMSPKEASACFEVTSAKRTSQDILGMLPDGQVLTLPKDTRLNANLAVCGSSGTGKSRAISRNLVLQAVKRGESVILTDPKSELYPDDQWQEILGACDSTVFLGCTDMLTAEYFSDRIGTASVEVEGTMRELNTMHITDYTPRFRKTNSLGRRPLLTPDEVLRLPPDQVLIFIRGQKVMRAKRFDYSLHPDYKKLKSRKAILHEPDWKNSQASSVSASGVSSPSVTAAIPAEKANVGSQKKPPGKPPRSTTRKVVNADELF